MTPQAPPKFFRPILAALIAGAGHLGHAAPPDDQDEPVAPKTVCAKHLSLVTAAAPTTFLGRALLRPELSHAAQIHSAPGLDERIARAGNVRPNALVRRPHLVLSLPNVADARVSPSSSLSDEDWNRMRTLVMGLTRQDLARMEPALARATDIYDAHFLTIKAWLPSRPDTPPIAALRLGRQHYQIDLRVRMDQRHTAGAYPKVRAVMTSRWRNAGHSPGGIFQPGDLPGGRGRDGVFWAGLVAEVEPNVGADSEAGRIEPLFERPPLLIRQLRGTWHYEHDWVTLRIFMLGHQKFLLK